MTFAPTRRPSSEKLPPAHEHSLVPVGMATILPEAARHVRRLESELLSYFHRYGYDEIILPTFEYFDVLAPGPSRHCWRSPTRSSIGRPAVFCS